MMPVECVARGYLTGSGPDRLPQDRRGVRHRAARRADRGEQVRRAAVHPGDARPNWVTTTRTSPSTTSSTLVGARAGRPAARPHPADLRPGRRARPDQGHHPRRHQVRVRRRRERRRWCWPTRCSPPTRRATGAPTPTGEGVVQPSFDKQFVRNWLTGPESGWDRGGDSAAATAACRDRRGHQGSLHRSLRTYFGPELRRLDRDRDRVKPPIAKRRRAPPGTSRRRLHRPLRMAAGQVRARRSSTTSRPRTPTPSSVTDRSGAAAAEDLRRDQGPHQGDRPLGAHPAWRLVVLRTQLRGQAVRRCNAVARSADPDDWTPPKFDEHTEIPGEQVLLDENVEAEGHDFFSLGAATVSVDGHILAYSVDVLGDERYTLRFKDLRTGELLRRRDRRDRRRARPGRPTAAPSTTSPSTTRGAPTPCGGTGSVPGCPAEQRVSRSRRTVLGRRRTHPQQQVRHHRRGQLGDLGDALRRRRRPRRPSSPSSGRGASSSSTRSTTPSSVARTASSSCTTTARRTSPSSRRRSAIPTAYRTLIEHRDDVRLDAVDAFDGHLVVSYRSEALPRIQLWPIDANGELRTASRTSRSSPS